MEVELQQLRSEAEGKATEHAQFQEAAANRAAEADRKAAELSAEIQILREQHTAECSRLQDVIAGRDTENRRLGRIVGRASQYIFNGLVPPTVLPNGDNEPGQPVTITLMLYEARSWK